MKKLIYGLIVLSLITIPLSTFAQDQTITITIPDAKVAKALEGFLEIYPNNEMTDDDPPVAKYTNKEWVTEKVRRLIVSAVQGGLQRIAQREVAIDDGVAVVE